MDGIKRRRKRERTKEIDLIIFYLLFRFFRIDIFINFTRAKIYIRNNHERL